MNGIKADYQLFVLGLRGGGKGGASIHCRLDVHVLLSGSEG